LAQYPSDPYDSTGYPANPRQDAPSYTDQYQAAPPAYNSNVQSYQDYQNSLSAYDAARNTAAQQSQAYNQDRADYQASRRAYRHRLSEYYRARAEYDAEYGAGAYEAYYGPPPPAPY
jgi:hypothetical protein